MLLRSSPSRRCECIRSARADSNSTHARRPRPLPTFLGTDVWILGRAILTLRDSYREGPALAVKQITDFKYVRFHAILHDEVGVYNEVDSTRKPGLQFPSYVDQIYDGLLKKFRVRPVVEISFMPKKLAFNPDALHPFWHKPNVSPPKSLEAWDASDNAPRATPGRPLRHRDEVSQWYFEVWNEPNIDFWGGILRKGSYFELYAHTARALKAVSPRLRVGGPATAAAAWVDDFLKYDAVNHVPVDFVSSHGYADDTVENLLSQRRKHTHGRPRLPGDRKGERADQRPLRCPTSPCSGRSGNVQGMHESRDTTSLSGRR